MLSCHFMHKDVICRLLQTRYAKNIPEAIDDPLYTWWPVNMQIVCTWIASRPRTSMQKRNEIRNVIWMKMRHYDMIQLIMLNTDLQESLHHPMPTVKKHRQSI